MMAVSMNRTEIPLKSISSDGGGGGGMVGDSMRDDKLRYDKKSVVMPPLRSAPINNVSGSVIQRGAIDQPTTNQHPIRAAGHSYSSDSDIVSISNTMATATAAMVATTTSSATAMRRLYFKSAKLSKTTQNSITTVHQQQAQHVPKVFTSHNTHFFL